MTPDEYRLWHYCAAHNETRVYGRGYMPFLRKTEPMASVVALIYQDWERGEVHLTQRRLNDFIYEYRVVRRRSKESIPSPLAA